MSKSWEHETDPAILGKPDYIVEAEGRNMRSIDSTSYSEETEDEAQTAEDVDEGWENKKQSSLAGRISTTIGGLRNSTYYPQTCGVTADICDECADTCDRFDEDFIKECVSVCRWCAESCREMAR